MPDQPPPPDALLVGLPEPMIRLAHQLRALVVATVPGAIERVHPGWRVIGYHVPVGRRRTAFFAWVMPQPEHVHLGFPHGVLLSDPDHVLGGAGEAKLARWLTATRADEIDPALCGDLLLEATSISREPGHVALARLIAAGPLARPTSRRRTPGARP